MRGFTYCPDCGKKGVQFRFAKSVPGEDGYGCRYCDFWFFTGSAMSMDISAQARWEAINEDTGAHPTDLEMGCEEPGLWWIEGIQVKRVGRGRWIIVWDPGVRAERVRSFREAKARIADALCQAEG